MTVTTKTLTNLATYGDMEAGWGNDSTHVKSGSKALKLVGSAGSSENVSQMPGTVALDPTHVYYFRMSVYTEDSALSGGAGVGMYWPIAEPGMDWKYRFRTADLGKWVDVSWTATRSSWTAGSYPMRVDFDNQSIAGTCWFDEVMIVDLTAGWGAGSEPSKAWCDRNLPFFMGTMPVAFSDSMSTGTVLSFPYSGNAVAVRLPKGQFKLEVWGAQGGYRSSATYGGKGGYSVGTLTLNGTRSAFVRAGGSGNTGGTSGGFNGGGLRGTYAGGGGGSDIRLGTDSLYARVIVAGGGGSDGSSSGRGGAGGGTAGQTYQGSGYGTNNGPGNTTYSGSSSSTTASSQSTTTSGSSTAIYGGFGFGGNGQYRSNGYGGAGGGGWYGGSGTYPDRSGDDDKAGAGGSGYVYTSGTASQYPSGCLLTSVDYLADASTTIGTSSFSSPSGSSETGHSGDGYCRITVIKADVTATWVADGAVVRTDNVPPGSPLTPPDVSKSGYTYVWQVNGVTVDVSTYDIEEDTTFTAVYTAAKYPVHLWDNGSDTVKQAQYGHSIDLPTASKGTGRFVGWWDGTALYTTSYTVKGSATLYARYDLAISRIVVDSVALQPNPVDAGKTCLASVSASAVDAPVPRWTDMKVTTGTGMAFSSPAQIQIWDTTAEEDLATFEAKGIKTTGQLAPKLTPTSTPTPRTGAWSDVIADGSGAISWTISGTGTQEYTSSIVVFSSERVSIRRGTVRYTSASGAVTTKTAEADGNRITFPSGTYKSFEITVTAVSEPYAHVRVLNVAPGGE